MHRQRRARWRSALLVFHRWFGLGASVWLLLLALTGSAIAFYDELDSWLNPELRRTGTGQSIDAVMPVELAIRNAQAALPGFEPSMLNFPKAPGETLWLLGHQDDGTIERDMQVFVRPDNGHVLGWRESGHFALDRLHLMDVLYGLHVDLLLGPVLTWFFGLVALLWMLDHVAALLLSVPRFAGWRDAFRIGGRPGGGRRRLDLHRAPGMWLLPLTFVLALSGVALAWPEASRDTVSLVSPVSGRLHYAFPEVNTTLRAIDADQAIALVRAMDPESRVHSLRLLPRAGTYAVRTFHPRDVDDQGRMWNYVAMDDGRIVGRRHDSGESAGDVFFAWQYALHSGKAFGMTGQVAVFIGGLGTSMLCLTGLWLWWRRRK